MKEIDVDKELIEKKHKEVLYPCVRVRTEKSGGSGTVVYSKPLEKDSEEYETYVLTNYHVIADNIKIEKKWSTLLQRDVKRDVKSTVHIDFTGYKWKSRAIGERSVEADIMAYDVDQDIALLKTRDPRQAEYVAKLYPKDKDREIYLFQPVYAVGAALGHPPIVTSGHIAGFGDEIDNYEYWLSTAPTIFGNSGGAVFLQETHEFIGIPSRIAVSITGFSVDAITHMSYFIPINRIYDFLEEQIFNFIYDDSYTSEQCEEMRKKKREEEELLLKKKAVLQGEDKLELD